MEDWLLAFAGGVGKMFLNPMIYWGFILAMLSGIIRIRRERSIFGSKINDILSELRHTWMISLLFGCLLSALMIGAGIIFSPAMIWVITVVIIVFSIQFQFTWMSPVYTVGASFLLLLILPVLLHRQSLIAATLLDHVNYSGLAILLALLLFAEAILLFAIGKKDIFAELTKSNRGVWTGVQHLKKMAFIPFFVPVPGGWIHAFADFWPYMPIGQAGDETFGLILFPMLIGFHFKISGFESQYAKKWLGKRLLLLAAVVLLTGVGSVYIGWLSIMCIFVAILGREFIHYRMRAKDRLKTAYFSQTDSGLRIVTVIPGTPADKLGILPGEIVTKVNGKTISDDMSFYQALRENGSYVKLTLLDEAGEKRFVQGALYEGDHHELGLVFVRKAFRESKTSPHEKATL